MAALFKRIVCGCRPTSLHSLFDSESTSGLSVSPLFDDAIAVGALSAK